MNFLKSKVQIIAKPLANCFYNYKLKRTENAKAIKCKQLSINKKTKFFYRQTTLKLDNLAWRKRGILNKTKDMYLEKILVCTSTYLDTEQNKILLWVKMII